MESLNIFIRSIFIDNMVFAFFFGMCSYKIGRASCRERV